MDTAASALGGTRKTSPSRNPPEAVIQGLSSGVEARRSLYSKLATAHGLLSIFI